jgi:hypothetical protein
MGRVTCPIRMNFENTMELVLILDFLVQVRVKTPHEGAVQVAILQHAGYGWLRPDGREGDVRLHRVGPWT